MENPNVLCEFCKKSFTKTTILKHIASNHLCKEHYGPRFLEMKKSRANEKKQNWRKLNKEKELENQRRLYAESSENFAGRNVFRTENECIDSCDEVIESGTS